MLTRKYGDTGLFICEYKGKATVAETRMQAMIMMEKLIRVLH